MTTPSPRVRFARRYAPIALTALVLLASVGCKRQSPATGAAAGADVHAIPTTQAGAFNVAFIYVGPIGDGGWTYTHDLGRRALVQAMPDVHTAYVENVAEGADCEHVLRALARKRFDLIIATSFGYMDAVEAVAEEFPKTQFLHIAGWKQNEKNFGNAFGAMEEMKYLGGMIAGGRAKADGRTALGYIAPFPIPEVVRLINATQLGARRTCPECTMDIRWINAWVDPVREQEAAESLFAAGADVVITGADTTLPLRVAGKRERYAIGYDSPTACDVEKTRCLTSTYWSWGGLYLDVVRQIRDGSWKPSAIYGDAGSGLVGLRGFGDGETPNPQIPVATIAEVRATLAAMRAGRFTRFDIFAGPLRDNTGRFVLPPGHKPLQADLLGTAGCTLCMSWLAEGIGGTLPRR